MTIRSRSLAAALTFVLLVSAALAGCGPEGALRDFGRPPREEYVDPAGPGGTTSLLLYEGGVFQLTECSSDPCDSDEPADLVAEGTWERSEGVLVLSTDEWEAVFVSAIVPLELRGRADTLRGLQWMQSSSETPVDSCRFVERSDFANFVHPPEGSGSSGW